jgi:transposase
MLNLFHQSRIFLHRQPADMRLGYEGLRNLASTTFNVNPYGGSLFVFFNRAHNRCKILVFDKGGFWLLSKRLEIGTFAVPNANVLSDKMEIDTLELTLFLEGILVTKMSRKKRFFPCEKAGIGLH